MSLHSFHFSPESMCAEIPMLRMYRRSNSDVTSAGDDRNELVDSALEEYPCQDYNLSAYDLEGGLCSVH